MEMSVWHWMWMSVYGVWCLSAVWRREIWSMEMSLPAVWCDEIWSMEMSVWHWMEMRLWHALHMSLSHSLYQARSRKYFLNHVEVWTKECCSSCGSCLKCCSTYFKCWPLRCCNIICVWGVWDVGEECTCVKSVWRVSVDVHVEILLLCVVCEHVDVAANVDSRHLWQCLESTFAATCRLLTESTFAATCRL